MSDLVSFASFLIITLLAASTGALFPPGAWYETLNKPSWCPPNWLFAPVWMVMYLMIAASGWLVWREVGFDGGMTAMIVFGVHLIFNALWSAVFFGMKRIDLAFFEIILLWATLVATIFVFAGINKLAALLLLPYLLWGTFAGALNWTMWQMNQREVDRLAGRSS